MPSWLLLLLAVAGCILWTALLAAGAMGKWRFFGIAARQFTLVLAGLSIPALLVLGWLLITFP